MIDDRLRHRHISVRCGAVSRAVAFCGIHPGSFIGVDAGIGVTKASRPRARRNLGNPRIGQVNAGDSFGTVL